MRKSGIIILLSVITVIALNAQDSTSRGNKQLNAGFGFSGWGVPIYVGMDFGVQHDITLGLEGSFRSYGQNFTGTRYNSTIIGFSGNGNYHFNRILEIPSQWDFYAGLHLGFFFWSSPTNYPGNGTSSVGGGAQIGGRYFFSNSFGINLEVVGSNYYAAGKFGITYRF
jgi:outer membrane immunogenic protein